MKSIQDNERFKQGLIEDLSAAETMSKQSASARGAPEASDFAPRALRIKNKIIGQQELTDTKSAIEMAIGELSSRTQFRDELEQAKFQNGLRKRFQQWQLMTLRNAGEFQKKLARQKMDEAEKSAAIKAFSDVIAGGTAAAIGQVGKNESGRSQLNVDAEKRTGGDMAVGGYGWQS